MMQRGPNQNQTWYCERCGQDTTHNIELVPSERCMLREGICAYRRFRECRECLRKSSPPGKPDGNIYTVEMDESDFNKVCKELDSLCKFRDAVQQALDVMGSNSVRLTSVKV